MRVIAGLYRHRELKMPKSNLTRPTKDMVKGAVFNALGVKINEAVVLDLFAGSGALGIEAISRGAKFTYFVDSSLDAKETILTNLNNLKIKNYQLIKDAEQYKLSVMCGTVALYEIKYVLNDNQIKLFEKNGKLFIDSLVKEIRENPKKSKKID